MYIGTDELPVTVIFIAFNMSGKQSTAEVLTPKHEVINLIQRQGSEKGANFCSKHKFIKLILRTQREQNVHFFSCSFLKTARPKSLS